MRIGEDQTDGDSSVLIRIKTEFVKLLVIVMLPSEELALGDEIGEDGWWWIIDEVVSSRAPRNGQGRFEYEPQSPLLSENSTAAPAKSSLFQVWIEIERTVDQIHTGHYQLATSLRWIGKWRHGSC